MLQSRDIIGNDKKWDDAIDELIETTTEKGKAATGFTNEQLKVWLDARQQTVANRTCSIYPVFVQNAKPQALVEEKQALFRLSPDFYSVLKDVSVAPNLNAVQITGLLMRVISDLYLKVRPDERQPTQNELRELLGRSQTLMRQFDPNGGVAALNDLVEALKVVDNQVPQQQSQQPQLQFDLDVDDVVMFKAESERGVQAHKDFAHTPGGATVKSRGKNFTMFQG
jgi:hypothetical protein